jgi:hypothetical protein
MRPPPRPASVMTPWLTPPRRVEIGGATALAFRPTGPHGTTSSHWGDSGITEVPNLVLLCPHDRVFAKASKVPTTRAVWLHHLARSVYEVGARATHGPGHTKSSSPNLESSRAIHRRLYLRWPRSDILGDQRAPQVDRLVRRRCGNCEPGGCSFDTRRNRHHRLLHRFRVCPLPGPGGHADLVLDRERLDDREERGVRGPCRSCVEQREHLTDGAVGDPE